MVFKAAGLDNAEPLPSAASWVVISNPIGGGMNHILKQKQTKRIGEAKKLITFYIP